MEALPSTLIPSQRRPVSSMSLARRRRQRCGSGRGRGVVVVRASRGRDHQWGRQVDENMIMLRLRIREIKMMEKKEDEEGEEGSGMMRWEREYYVGEYGKHVCEVLGLLQSYLMSVRPCLAVGIVLLVTSSVLMSSGLFLFNSINTMNTLLS